MKVLIIENSEAIAKKALESILDGSEKEVEILPNYNDFFDHINKNAHSFGFIELNDELLERLFSGRYKIFAEVAVSPKKNFLGKTKSKQGERRFLFIGRSFYEMPSTKSNKVSFVFKLKKREDIDDLKTFLDKSNFKLESLKENPLDLHHYFAEVKFKNLLDLGQLEDSVEDFHILGIYQEGKVIS